MPAFRAGKPKFRLGLLANQTLGLGWQDIWWDVQIFDDVNGWTGGREWVPDRPGLFLLGVAIGRGSVAPASSAGCQILVNGVQQTLVQQSSGTATAALNGSTLVELEQGDLVSAKVLMNTSGAGTLQATQTFLWGARIGPKAWT